MKTRDLIYCALFAALTAIGAFIHFQFMHATITLQCFFTAMAGLLLGARLGALSQALYVGLGLVGLPIFAAGGGFSYVFNPTFGFLLGLIPAAWVIGRLAEKNRTPLRLALACAAGFAVLYAIGLPYIALIVNVYNGGAVSAAKLATAYMLPYLPGDCLKIVVSVLLAPRILRAMARNGAKRCGHRPNKAIVSKEEMVDRIRAAVDAKTDPDFVIMARTDALAVEGLDAAIERAQAYVEAGAEMLFPEAITELAMYRQFADAVQVPILSNITEFGATPLFTTDELRSAHVAMALYPLSAFRAMNRAAEHVYNILRQEGTQKSVIDTMQTRNELYESINYYQYEEKLDDLFARGQVK